MSAPFLIRWRRAFMSAQGPHSTTRLVLQGLASFMELGRPFCWPSAEKVAERTGLSERTVRERLTEAEEAGWVERSKRQGTGRGWALTMYRARIPEVLKEIPDPTEGKGQDGAEADSGRKESRALGPEYDARGPEFPSRGPEYDARGPEGASDEEAKEEAKEENKEGGTQAAAPAAVADALAFCYESFDHEPPPPAERKRQAERLVERFRGFPLLATFIEAQDSGGEPVRDVMAVLEHRIADYLQELRELQQEAAIRANGKAEP